MQRVIFTALLFGIGTTPCAALPSGDAVKGEQLYESRCTGCHSVDANRVGPKHRGVVGRIAGSVADFNYSPALKKAGGPWTPERLDMWLTNPQKLIPGARMGFRLAKPEDRADVIAYLQSVSPAPTGSTTTKKSSKH